MEKNMSRTMQAMLAGAFTATALGCLLFLLATPGPAQTRNESSAESAAEPAPPAGQTYVGTKKCAACHFDQYLLWRQDKHAKAFDILPAKYKTDASCLKCHTTGYGESTGYKSSADVNLAGISCEACHGAGSKHEELCKPFAQANKLSPDQEKLARDSIYRMLPENVCATCHTSKGHKPHPTFDK